MKFSSLSFLVLLGFNVIVFQGVWEKTLQYPLQVYFLDVGQGDSQLILFPGGVKMLIDGGPDKELLFELGEVMSPTDKYIDLVFITHAQIDHYGGIRHILETYQIGAFVFNGEEGVGDAWDDFKMALLKKDIPVVILGEGDRVKHKDIELRILGPTKSLLAHSDINEGSLVIELDGAGVKTLFTGDIGIEAEEIFTEKYDLDVDVLKVGHHGSRYSSSMGFLEATTPLISVIGVGSNRFGHPHPATLQRLSRVGSSIYRTDEDGRVKLIMENGVVGVEVETNI